MNKFLLEEMRVGEHKPSIGFCVTKQGDKRQEANARRRVEELMTEKALQEQLADYE